MLWHLALPLPALQQVATRLQALDLSNCSLQGSTESFLTKGWTALTSLCLGEVTEAEDNMCSALQLPALETASITQLFRHRGGLLQLDQLTSSCLQINRLEFLCSLARPREASKQQSSLLNLSRLADLRIMDTSLHADLDLELPASLTFLELRGSLRNGHSSTDLFWVLLQAVKCIKRGAQLHTLVSRAAETLLQPAQWGATLEEQYRRLGGQLSGLKELDVRGVAISGDPLLSAVSAVASSAPSLTRLVVSSGCNELPPICSGSLESLVFAYNRMGPWARPVILTLLPGCIRLQEVLVQYFAGPGPGVGSEVRICCYPASPTCIVPTFLHVQASQAAPADKVGIQFRPVAPSTQARQGYIVTFACHADGPQQPLKWGHVVCPVVSGMDG